MNTKLLEVGFLWFNVTALFVCIGAGVGYLLVANQTLLDIMVIAFLAWLAVWVCCAMVLIVVALIELTKEAISSE